ncbi:MAG: FecR domain-containing protein, partial [Caulobacterales bacterium]|nr:FecR domain-containing protein [Caulobacterales bacterium]
MTNEARIISIDVQDEKRSRASEWLAKLDRGELSEEERNAFAAWLQEDPDNKSAIRAAAAVWFGLNRPLRDIELAAGLAPQPSTRRRGVRVGGAVAACLLLAVVTAGAIAHLVSRDFTHTGYYSTVVGETQVVALNDGSKIYLNTNSSVEQAYSRHERLVRLLSGEAIFDVAHEAGRPFVVYASDGVIRAVGTRFAVRVTDD